MFLNEQIWKVIIIKNKNFNLKWKLWIFFFEKSKNLLDYLSKKFWQFDMNFNNSLSVHEDNFQAAIKGLVFAELITYIFNLIKSNEKCTHFQVIG